MKKNTCLTYIAIIFCIMQFLSSVASAEEYKIPPELQKGNKVAQQTFSLWLGGSLGAYFASDDIHNYLKEHVRNDPLSLYLSLSVKGCFQISPLPWLQFQTVTAGSSSVNYSGNLLRKHPLNKAMAGFMPGVAFASDDSHYMINAGMFIHYFAFHNETASGIGYRLKLTIIPFVNDLIDFPTVRGTITFDYAYAQRKDFQLGHWGFQVGFEILVW